MRDVILYMSMSLDGFVASDREHPGVAIPERKMSSSLRHVSLRGLYEGLR